MIHGLWCTGEIWNRMAGALREKGWRVEAPTIRAQLRPRDNPPPELAGLGLADYVADMEGEARRLAEETGRTPVVFGHSFGALIAQKLAERGAARAVVLLAATAPAGVRVAAAMSPVFALGNVLFRSKLETRAIMVWRRGFLWGFLNRVPVERRAAIYESLRPDSGSILKGLLRPKADPQRTGYVDETRIAVPMLTIGTGKDRINPIGTQRRVADKYRSIGGEYLEYPDSGHWIVDEPETERVIGDVAGWLDAKAPAERAG